METTFHNILITITSDPKEAYRKLCELLHAPGVEYTTDTYTTYDGEEATDAASTEDLFPKEFVK